ncbi:MAG: hypothetical protein K5790_05830 [Nitrosopumilus sp.]|nr:hypothetical protein [Nitrosopumilus sp.]MCV0392800.1 hypothetical protein [Nitrosopumilus sp.]
MAFKIKYRFKDETKYYSCIMTYEQFKNFQVLPIVEECEVMKKDVKNIEAYKADIQRAVNLAVQNSTSHIKKLSEPV